MLKIIKCFRLCARGKLCCWLWYFLFYFFAGILSFSPVVWNGEPIVFYKRVDYNIKIMRFVAFSLNITFCYSYIRCNLFYRFVSYTLIFFLTEVSKAQQSVIVSVYVYTHSRYMVVQKFSSSISLCMEKQAFLRSTWNTTVPINYTTKI